MKVEKNYGAVTNTLCLFTVKYMCLNPYRPFVNENGLKNACWCQDRKI